MHVIPVPCREQWRLPGICRNQPWVPVNTDESTDYCMPVCSSSNDIQQETRDQRNHIQKIFNKYQISLANTQYSMPYIQFWTSRERSKWGLLLRSRVRCLWAELTPPIGVSCTQNSFKSLLCTLMSKKLNGVPPLQPPWGYWCSVNIPVLHQLVF